ncbi:MAG: CoA pyrophosphatase [SAR202 cluster bacterium]|jgi:8-oxo-dGTP pyrophosphatase MutT (NUDIX family)|nr:CoA pyrophosphatase [SAR202 cluster bacterium]
MLDSPMAAVREALSVVDRQVVSDPSFIQASVMVLLYLRDGEYHILLNKRSDSVEDHKGEMAFPGGRMEPTDASPEEAALRETFEEMGVRPEDVGVLGPLGGVTTPSGYFVNPFVGTIPGAYHFTWSASEVAEVVEVPLSTLVEEGTVPMEVSFGDGRTREFDVYLYEGHVIFGATASILGDLLRVLERVPDEEAPWRSGRS